MDELTKDAAAAVDVGDQHLGAAEHAQVVAEIDAAVLAVMICP